MLYQRITIKTFVPGEWQDDKLETVMPAAEKVQEILTEAVTKIREILPEGMTVTIEA